MVITVSKMM